jgi:hypothetical protein
MKPRPGQILILVLLIVVVSLSVGLSVASRNITNLRSSTQSEQSQRAFSAAEGGVEDVLTDLSGIVSDPGFIVSGETTKSIPVGDITADVSIKASNIFEAAIDEGSVGQVTLDGYSGNVIVEWILQGDPAEDASNRASMEFTFVCENPSCFGEVPNSSGLYSQHRLAYSAESISGQSGFTSCTRNPLGDDFYCKVTISVPLADNVKLMRLRPFWRKATVRVSGDSGFPTQTYDVVSTASTDLGITRKVQVTRTALPQLPAALDFVLFSEGDIVK